MEDTDCMYLVFDRLDLSYDYMNVKYAWLTDACIMNIFTKEYELQILPGIYLGNGEVLSIYNTYKDCVWTENLVKNARRDIIMCLELGMKPDIILIWRDFGLRTLNPKYIFIIIIM